MSMLGISYETLKCPECKRTVIKIVPINPKDQQHIGKMVCRDCKKKYIKNKQKLLVSAKNDEVKEK